MKIIIAGAGDVGIYLAKMLYQAKEDITIIDVDSEKLSYIDSHFDFMTVKGSATSIEVLKNADIKRTSLFISVTEVEEVNITSAILAKKLGAKKVIARITNKEYAQPENQSYITDLGIDELIYPELLASDEIQNTLNQTGAQKSYEFDNGELSLFEIRLAESAPIVGKTLQEVTHDSDEFDYRTVAITRDGETIIPHSSDVFKANDLMYVICNPEGISRLMKYSGKEKFVIKDLMIMGGSRIGKKTALNCEKKCNVKLLEISSTKAEILTEDLTKTLVINGDGRDAALLKEEGIMGMDAFIAVTGNSETNILACWHAKKLGVRKTIAEVENMDYLDIAEKMGIDSIINKKLIAASKIYAHVMAGQITKVQCLTGTLAEVLEFEVPENARIIRKRIRDHKFPKQALIGGVVRNGKSFIAKGDSKIMTGDHVLVFALPEAISKVTKFFR